MHLLALVLATVFAFFTLSNWTSTVKASLLCSFHFCKLHRTQKGQKLRKEYACDNISNGGVGSAKHPDDGAQMNEKTEKENNEGTSSIGRNLQNDSTWISHLHTCTPLQRTGNKIVARHVAWRRCNRRSPDIAKEFPNISRFQSTLTVTANKAYAWWGYNSYCAHVHKALGLPTCWRRRCWCILYHSCTLQLLCPQ